MTTEGGSKFPKPILTIAIEDGSDFWWVYNQLLAGLDRANIRITAQSKYWDTPMFVCRAPDDKR